MNDTKNIQRTPPYHARSHQRNTALRAIRQKHLANNLKSKSIAFLEAIETMDGISKDEAEELLDIKTDEIPNCIAFLEKHCGLVIKAKRPLLTPTGFNGETVIFYVLSEGEV